MTITDRLSPNDDGDVDCIACGATISRSEAREYHKDGDRWNRADKHIEYLCKPCHNQCTHQSRKGLEEMLVRIGAGDLETSEFIERYYAAAGIELERRE